MRKFKIIILIGLMIMLSTPCFARKTAQWSTLKSSAGVSLVDYALTSGSAVYTEAILIKNNVGNPILFVVENKAGGAGDVDISVEYSVDGVTFMPVYTTNMAGTIAVEGNIVTALQNVTRYITHAVYVGVYMRYKLDPDADSQVTVKNIIQVEN